MDIYKFRKLFLLSQAVVLLFAFVYDNVVGRSSDYTFVFLYSLWNTLSYAFLFIAEMRLAPDFHPFQILSLACVQFLGLNGLSISITLLSGEYVYAGGEAIDGILYLGIMYLSLQHLLLYLVFYYFENKRYRGGNRKKIIDSIRGSNIDFFRWAKYTYLAVWVFRLINIIIPLTSIVGSSITGFALIGYQIVLYFLLFAAMKSPKNSKYMKYHWIVVIIEILLVLGHGMKEEIIKALIPYCVYLIIMYKSKLLRIDAKMMVRFALLGFFVIGFVFPYISVFRTISTDTGRKWADISIAEGMSAYFDYITGDPKYNSDESRGVDYLMSRAGSICANTWAINYERNNGPTPQFFAVCAIAGIPRIIWPSKPVMVIGGMIDNLKRGDSNWLAPGDADDYGNADTLGFVGGVCFSFGTLGAIVIILLLAMYMSFLWNYIRSRLHYNFMALFVFMNFVFILLKDFEAFSDCGVAFVTVNSAYIILTWLVDKKMKKNQTGLS